MCIWSQQPPFDKNQASRRKNYRWEGKNRDYTHSWGGGVVRCLKRGQHWKLPIIYGNE